MEKTLELQKEFESLIKNLNRLRSAADLTEKNSLNSKLIIEEIEKFVNSTKSFQGSISEDFKKQQNDLDKSRREFESTIKRIESAHESYSLEYQSILTTSTNELIEKVNQLTAGLSKQIDILEENTQNLEESVTHSLREELKIQSSLLNSNSSLLKETFISIDEDHKAILKNLDSEFHRNRATQKIIIVILILTVALIIYGVMMN